MSVAMHRTGRTPTYDRTPTVHGGHPDECIAGWDAIVATIRARSARIVIVETYAGLERADVEPLIRMLGGTAIDTREALKDPGEIERMVEPFVTDDPVFGYLTSLRLDDFFDAGRLARAREQIRAGDGPIVVHGPGAALFAPDGVLVYVELPRWEAQMRMRAGRFRTLGATAPDARWQDAYKHAYFVDWRVADAHKKTLWDRMDYVLDCLDASAPTMIEGSTLLRALHDAARRPFRVVPTFDPAPWGGQWMKEICDLPRDVANYGWCFDCVPEENSLLLAFGDRTVEIPSVDLVFREPLALLGSAVYGRFGDEFPIRFDFLDTMDGGTLSLQVHPLTEYIQHSFGMHYTQDESYYMLDAEPDAGVYLGVKDGVDPDAMLAALRRAEAGDEPFDAERYVNLFPAARHDHFLIPAGTIHCSRRSMVLEISATPYIFTFKLWDWNRPGLDGKPRPIHLDHGANVIRWERDTDYAKRHLVNQITPIASGDGWREERTGLHEAEFIETRRHWFTGTAPHDTRDGVHVLNLVQGEEATVRSPDDAFEPFVVHYAETFIVPAAVGPYTITPSGIAAGSECATIEASVRTNP